MKEEMQETLPLFKLPEKMLPEPKVRFLKNPVWTENKAKLIERYLHYFVFITKHGTYIDGFAGPQNPHERDSWAAKLVLESEPRWLRNFYLFDSESKQVAMLKALESTFPKRDPRHKESDRSIHIDKGDFNTLILELLESRKIKQSEATFCLLDQRTFECQWTTVQALARYKTSGHKIELLYFLPIGWLDRAFSGLRNSKITEKWWGREDWPKLREMNSRARTDAFVVRFKQELGYRSVMPWPIYERKNGGRLMYHMIHATDHPAAPSLMWRAYNKTVMMKKREEQLELPLLTQEEKHFEPVGERQFKREAG